MHVANYKVRLSIVASYEAGNTVHGYLKEKFFPFIRQVIIVCLGA